MRIFTLLTLGALCAVPGGVTAQPIPAPLAEPANEDGWLGVVLDDDSGEVLARQVLPSSPAHEAGLQRGDTILSIDGTSVVSSSALIELVRQVGAGGQASLSIRRGMSPAEIQVTLGTRPPNMELAQALVGTPFPWLASQDVRTGESLVPLAERETWTVVEFWATWCGPCHLAAPRMIELYASRDEDRVEFVGIALDSEEDLLSFLDRSDLSWPQVADPDGARNSEALVIAQPTWFLVAPGGEIRAAFIGLGGLDQLERALGDLESYSPSSPK